MNRRLALVILLVVCAAAVFAQPAAPLRVTVSLTWDLGLRVGVDYRAWDHVGFSADIGSTLFILEGAFALTGDAFVVLYALPPESRVQVSACLGLVDGRYVFTSPGAAMFAFGGSVQGSYGFTERLDAFIRLGGGVPFFLEDGEFGRRDVSFPLGLWPDLTAGVKFSL